MNDTEKAQSFFHRYVDDLYTMEDAHKLLYHLEDPVHKDILDEVSLEVWEEAAMQSFISDFEREKCKKEAYRLLQHIGHKRNVWFQRIAIVAASMVAVVVLLWAGIDCWNYINKQQISYLEASTTFGERKQIQLPDGTLLILNACSHVRYPNHFIGKERRIDLEGEGYFRVHRNEKQTFVVNTERLSVRVLGTCFNIKSYAADEVVSVDVENGKVQVDLPEASMKLQAQEQILINTVSGDYNKLHEKHLVAVWRKGGLYFKSTPICDVAKELERMYNCKIVFAEGQEFENLISGEHDNLSLESVLQSIRYTSGIQYKKEGNHILFYKY